MQAYHWKLQSAFERSTFLLALKTKITIRTNLNYNGTNKINNGKMDQTKSSPPAKYQQKHDLYPSAPAPEARCVPT